MQLTRLIVLCLFIPVLLPAQRILWPGDINNNGVVNSVDVLYLGLGFGKQGPPRSDQEDDWEATEIDQLWPGSFPDGINLAYADCDGNGRIDEDDLEVIADNFGLTHGIIGDDGFANGLPNIDPPLEWVPAQSVFAPGTTETIELALGAEDLPVNDFYGMAMEFSYTSNLIVDKQDTDPLDDDDDDDDFDDDDEEEDEEEEGDFDEDDDDTGGSVFNNNIPQDSIVLNLIESSWIHSAANDSLLRFLITNRNTGRGELAIVRTDQRSIPEGQGAVGLLTIVIEDIIVGREQPDTLHFRMDRLRLIDTTLATLAVVPDTLQIPVTADTSFLTNTAKLSTHPVSIDIFPNPTTQGWQVRCEQPISGIALYDLRGREVPCLLTSNTQYQYWIRPQLPQNGIFLLRLTTPAGTYTQKVTFISQ